MKNKLIALVLAAALTVPLVCPTSACSNGEEETLKSNLTLNKTVSYNSDDKSYTINLESYATGNVLVTEGTKATDFILVLDESSSMAQSMNTAKSYSDLSNKSLTNEMWSDYNNLYFNPLGSENYYPIKVSRENNYNYILTCTATIDNNNINVNLGKKNSSTNLSNVLLTKYGLRGEIVTGQYQSRLKTLKDTASEFIEQVHENAVQNSVDHRVAVVGFSASSNSRILSGTSSLYYDSFSDGDETFKTCLKSVKNYGPYNDALNSVNCLTTQRGTNAQAGIDLAQKIIENSVQSDTDRNTAVIFISDGVPTETGRFDSTIATGAIQFSGHLKLSAKQVKVYSIGIFKGADPDEFLNISACKSESQLANRFLNLLSSNYPKATTFNYPGADGFTTGYYLTANSKDELSTAFETISNKEIQSGTTLGTSAVIKDVVSQYFALPENVQKSDISVSTVKCTGEKDENGNFIFDYDTKTPLALSNDQIVIDTVNNTVCVSGFDFKNTCCTETARTVDNENYYGEKLVISFKIKAKQEFMGGNSVPTNDYILNEAGNVVNSSGSGIYADNTAKEPLQNFNQPTVNVEINPQYKNIAMNVYAGNALPDLKEYVNATVPDNLKWTADYIKFGSYSCDSAENNTLSDHIMNFTQYVSPTISKNAASEIGPVQDDTKQALQCAITVFHPVIPCTDSTIFLGDKAAEYLGTNITNAVDKINWKHVDPITKAVAYSTDSNIQMEGSEPTLNYNYDIEPGYFEEDTPIDVKKVFNGTYNSEITSLVEFTNDDAQPEGKEFTVHVKSCTINLTKAFTDNKSYDDDKETFIFTIKGTSGNAFTKGINLTVVLSKTKLAKTITRLPSGTYSITENTGWSWRYTPDSSNKTEVTVNQDNSEASVTFKNTLNNSQWLNGYSEFSNVFTSDYKQCLEADAK